MVPLLWMNQCSELQACSVKCYKQAKHRLKNSTAKHSVGWTNDLWWSSELCARSSLESFLMEVPVVRDHKLNLSLLRGRKYMFISGFY